MLSDLTRIAITDEEGRRELATLGEFIADNGDAFDERDVAALRAELAAYRPYHMGGGAGPLFTIRNVEPIA
ncbi:MAG: hypothetical protein IPK85_02305 [Gemmatimonadetes bacterium]|nr:hypothetical protein [Gemmatimonadota bacterium]